MSLRRSAVPALAGVRVRLGSEPARSRPETRRRLRLPTAERRLQIIHVALELFARHGFTGTTTRSIAERAGVTEAVIFQHFPDKDALYAAVLAHKADEWPSEPWLAHLGSLVTAGDDEAVVREVFTRILDRHERDPHCLRLMVFSALEHHALSRRMQGAQSLRLYRVLEQFVTGAQKAGRFGPGAPAVLVRAILAQPILHVVQRRLFRSGWPAVNRDELIETGVALVLGGLRQGTGCADRSARTATEVA